MKRVLVLNHFAGEFGAPGGTRHVEMFSRLRDWSYLIAVGSHAKVDDAPTRSKAGYLALPTVPFTGNGIDRIVNWASYAVSAVPRLSIGSRPDVVYASSPHLLAGLAGYLLSLRWRVPLVLEVRDLWPQVLVDMGQMEATSPVYRALESIETFLYAKADRIVVMAEGTREYLVDKGVPADTIEFIPNAADPEDFTVATPRAELRERFEFTRCTCVYTGAHGPANGLDLLLDAAADLAGEDVDIVLVGNGPSKPDLQECARDRGLSNVRFLDPIPKAEIPALMAAADIGLHVLADVPLFRYGVSPNKVFDYLASGLPMVTNVPGEVGALVTESGGGIAVAPAGLAAGIRKIMGCDSVRFAAVGRAGQEYMRKHRSRTAMAARLQVLLDGMVRV